MKPMPQTRNKIAGLTLIEVLITIVILAVGLLGMAAMQVVGIRSANGSGFRTQASLLANDIAERMRANPTAIDNNTFLDIDSADIDCSAPPATYCSAYFDGDAAVAAASCTSAQLATYDINTWFCGEVNSGARTGGVAGSLPQSSATIACTDADGADAAGDACSIGSTHTITVSWVEPNTQRNGDATVEQSISIILQP